MNDMHTTKTAADFLGITPQAVHKAIKAERLKAERLGATWLIRTVELKRYQKARTRAKAAPARN